MIKTKYLIIGSSAAGCNCVEGIRSVDKTGSITMVSLDDKIIYSRPVIAEYLTDKLDAEEIKYRNNDFIKKNKVDFIPNSEITKIVPVKKIAYISKEQIQYEKLFFGVGGAPIVPPELDITNKNIFTFTSINEVSRLKKLVANIDEFTVVGAGFIGLEVAHSLSKLNKKVNLIELAPRVLLLQSDKFLSEYISNFLSKQNIKIYTNTGIKEVVYDEKNNIQNIILTDEQMITSSIIVCCIGVRPSLNLAKKSGLKINRGIVVNKYLQTNKKNIYAAGDVIETTDLSTGDIKPIPLWFAASEQGLKAGKNMAGEKVSYEGTIPMSPLKFLDIPGLSTGDVTNETDDNIIYKTIKPQKIYKKYFIENNILKGYILLNDLNNAGIFTKMIKNKIEITDKIKNRLINDTFNLADLPENVIRADYGL